MKLPPGRLGRLIADLSREPDSHLLSAFLGGSQAAFRELVDRHGPCVFGVCNRILRHRQDAEDAFQAVFLVLARRAADVWPRDAVGSWLYGVAYRVALKARTLRIRRQGREHPLEDVAQPGTPTLEPDTAEMVDRAVRKLPEVYRAAVVACDLEGLSRKDAAGRLGWTEGTLSGRLARARRLLADRLRKAGLSLPATGLVAILGTNSPVRAGLPEAVMRLTFAATSVSAPVAALTEGVVPGMFAFKLKSAIAAILVTCTIGFGAWTVGAGDGPGSSPTAEKGLAPPPTAKPVSPDLTKARDELKLIEQELTSLLEQSKKPGVVTPEDVQKRIRQTEARLAEFQRLMAQAREQLKNSLPEVPAKIDPALKMLEGRWRIDSIADGTTVMPADPKSPQVIEIAGNTLVMPYRESGGTMKQLAYKIGIDAKQNPKSIDLIQPGKPVGRGIYEFTAPMETCIKCHEPPFPDAARVPKALLSSCEPGFKTATGMRLAIANTGPRPTKFTFGDGVIEFRLSRIVHDAQEDVRERAKKAEDKLILEAWWKDEGTNPSHGELGIRKAEVELRRAMVEVEAARAEYELIRAQVARSQAIVENATKNLQAAQERLAAARKTAAKPVPPLPAKEEPSFSIHVRTQYAAEKVIQVKITGSQSVLEGLAYAAEDMAIKPDAVTVWVLRDKAVLPVDLAAITQKGVTATNYALKAGDRLFVQVKVK